MEKLSSQQIWVVYNHLIRSGLSNNQSEEVIGPLVTKVEYYMWIGLPFDAALNAGLEEAEIKTNLKLALTDEQLLEAGLDDIVFQHRNKAYGAYDLRRAYRTTLRNAFIIAISLCMMGMAMMDLISRREWSYLSLSGAIWLIGLIGVTYAGFNWYMQHLRQQQMLSR